MSITLGGAPPDEPVTELVGTIVVAAFSDETYQARLSTTGQPVAYGRRYDSPGEALEEVGQALDAQLTQRVIARQRARDGTPRTESPITLANGATAEDTARVVEVIEDAGAALALDTITERAGIPRDRAELAVEQAWTDGALKRLPVEGTAPMYGPADR